MREIKFRAWIQADPYDESDSPKMEMCYNLAFEDYEPMNDLLGAVEHLMQYTGLKDKNGVEIYEGDILKAKHDDGQYDTGEVVYGSKGAFCMYLPFASGVKTPLLNYIHGMMFPEYDFEVIGNIYENPELMEATQ